LPIPLRIAQGNQLSAPIPFSWIDDEKLNTFIGYSSFFSAQFEFTGADLQAASCYPTLDQRKANTKAVIRTIQSKEGDSLIKKSEFRQFLLDTAGESLLPQLSELPKLAK